MQLLDMPPLEPFTRYAWHTPQAKRVWEPVLRNAWSTVGRLELLTVKYGLRLCAIQHLAPRTMAENLLAMTQYYGLYVTPVRWVKAWNGVFAHRHTDAEPAAQDATLYCAVSADPDVGAAMRAAHEALPTDHRTIGRLLGFPECCIAFFEETFLRGYVDPVWQAALRTPSRSDVREETVAGYTTYVVEGLPAVPGVSPLGRYVNARASFHIPCRFDCPETVALARRVLELAEAEGLDVEWWPWAAAGASWDCAKGVAVVRYPLIGLDLALNSVPCWPRYVVKCANCAN